MYGQKSGGMHFRCSGKIHSDDILMSEYRAAHAAFLEILPQLTEVQQGVLLDYLGVCVEIHLRMLEGAIK